jgi:phenylacetate-CoA ligase
MTGLKYAARGWVWRVAQRELPRFHRDLAALEESERWSAGRLESAVWAQAEAHAGWALSHSPFYRRVAERESLGDGEPISKETWHRLPLISKDDIHADPSAFLTRPAAVCWRATTSGTTGTPRTVYRDLRSSIFHQAVLWRQWRWFGISNRDRRITLRGHRLFPNEHPGPTFWRENRADGRLIMSGYHLGPKTFDAYWSAIVRYQPTVIEGYPSMLNALAVLMEARGAGPYPVRAVLASSEPLAPAAEARINRAFPGPVAERYGQEERVCSIGRCEENRMHVFPEDGLVEFRPLPDGDGRCEIVGSALHNRAFPLLRYRTGDVVQPRDEACPCGRAFQVTGPVEGRISDLVVTSDGRWVWPTHLLVDVVGVAECQIVQSEPGKVTCLLVPDARFADDTPATVAAAVRRDLGPNEQVDVEVVERLDRTLHGKLQRIKSYLPLESLAAESPSPPQAVVRPLR